jgi:hypothetical protein
MALFIEVAGKTTNSMGTECTGGLKKKAIRVTGAMDSSTGRGFSPLKTAAITKAAFYSTRFTVMASTTTIQK